MKLQTNKNVFKSVGERIIFLDEEFAIINKICGEVCSFDEGKIDEGYLPKVFEKAICEKLGKNPEIIECVNRIDKPVSGLVILALTKRANAELSNQLKIHKIQKVYYAIVEGCYKPFPVNKEACLLRHYLWFNSKNQKAYASKKSEYQYKLAELRYRVVGAGERYSFLKIELITGRTHQIRCQLSENKMPIKGDLKYGAKRSEKMGGIRLHAGKIALFHPVTKEYLEFFGDFPFEDNLWLEVKKSIKNIEDLEK